MAISPAANNYLVTIVTGNDQPTVFEVDADHYHFQGDRVMFLTNTPDHGTMDVVLELVKSPNHTILVHTSKR